MRSLSLFFAGIGLFAAGFFIGYPGAGVYERLDYYERHYGHHTTNLDMIQHDHCGKTHKQGENCPIDIDQVISNTLDK